VESSCEFGIEPSGSIKCWETIEWPIVRGLLGNRMLARGGGGFPGFGIRIT
jgi:hypothetical protein